MKQNNRKTEYPAICVHHLFERQAKETPDMAAILSSPQKSGEPDRTLTYRELNECANQLAHYLKSPCCGTNNKEETVGLYIKRSPEMIIAILAILKAGAAYMPIDTPNIYIGIDKMPLTPSGKLDRKALPDFEKFSRKSNAPVMPLSETEQIIADIWEKILDTENISKDDNFFDLGGTSLLLTRVHNRLVKIFGEEFPTSILFRYPTIRDLSAYLNKGEAGGDSAKAKKAGTRKNLLKNQRKIRLRRKKNER